MRKIKRLSQLYREQLRLRREREDMEHTLRRDWHALTSGFQPAALAKEAVASATTWLGKKIFTK